MKRSFADFLLGVLVVALLLSSAGDGVASEWNCFRSFDGKFIDNVFIWWGETPGNAAWACNNWISECGKGGGCTATGGNNQEVVVWIYEDADGYGAYAGLRQGQYDWGQLGIRNDSLSSLTVTGDGENKVTLYADVHYSGEARSYNGAYKANDIHYVGDDFNDITSSIVVSGCNLETRVDGCSIPFSDVLSNSYKEVFRDACNAHDACYHAPWDTILPNDPGRGFDVCNNNFWNDMNGKCNSWFAGSIWWLGCRTVASVWADTMNDDFWPTYTRSQFWHAFQNDQQWVHNNCSR